MVHTLDPSMCNIVSLFHPVCFMLLVGVDDSFAMAIHICKGTTLLLPIHDV